MLEQCLLEEELNADNLNNVSSFSSDVVLLYVCRLFAQGHGGESEK